MKKSPFFYLILIAGIGLLSGIPWLTHLDASPLIKLNKVQVKGSVTASIRPGEDSLAVNIYLYVKGKPLPGQKVKVNGVLIPEQRNGYYFKFIKSYQAVPSQRVTVSAEPMNPQSILQGGDYRIMGSANIGTLIKILSPFPDRVVDLGHMNSLPVRWSPSMNNIRCMIFEFNGERTGPNVYDQIVSGDTVNVPKTCFVSGKKYGIYLYREMEKFILSGDHSPNSDLGLKQSIGTYITIK